MSLAFVPQIEQLKFLHEPQDYLVILLGYGCLQESDLVLR
jgi:hypothetical protein